MFYGKCESVGRPDLADSGKGKITGLDKGNRDMSTGAGSLEILFLFCALLSSQTLFESRGPAYLFIAFGKIEVGAIKKFQRLGYLCASSYRWMNG